eukprot:TRINITY_DN9867_c0_g1_i1.p1 TRINITY_DN9867_c0_g1~~TRINITY_DN9867_c0_g1_i1.p1  ORF type:complete len:321 (+),score=33.82 TRINITY_DN9867_c0_g1_i1:307-1269(+)
MGVQFSSCTGSQDQTGCSLPTELCGSRSQLAPPLQAQTYEVVLPKSPSKVDSSAGRANTIWSEEGVTTSPRSDDDVPAVGLVGTGEAAPPEQEGLSSMASLQGAPKWQAVISSVRWAGMSAFGRGPSPQDAGAQEAKPCGNVNRPQDYVWLRDALTALARNEARTFGCTDLASGSSFEPIFFVIGACPNVLCGMQAVVYCVCPEARVDFWWVKPSKTAPTELEEATLNRHSKGPHKNDPGRSRQFYKPLADVFENGEVRQGWRFGIQQVQSNKGTQARRAYLQSETGKSSPRLYVHLFWQEDWTTNPLARSKYIKANGVR